MTRFRRKYLLTRNSPRREIGNTSDDRSMHLRPQGAVFACDELDEKLVWALGNRPYDSLRELARFIGSPLATVDRRVKRLQSEGVIQGFFYDLNVTKLGIQSFRVLVQVQGLSCSLRESITKICAQHPLVVYMIEVLGSWDFEIGVEASDPRAVSSVVEELYSGTGRRIGNVRVVTELEDFICRHYPGKLGSGAPRM